jgi:hypothetical protein
MCERARRPPRLLLHLSSRASFLSVSTLHLLNIGRAG